MNPSPKKLKLNFKVQNIYTTYKSFYLKSIEEDDEKNFKYYCFNKASTTKLEEDKFLTSKKIDHLIMNGNMIYAIKYDKNED
jgi:hypothetical protein